MGGLLHAIATVTVRRRPHHLRRRDQHPRARAGALPQHRGVRQPDPVPRRRRRRQVHVPGAGRRMGHARRARQDRRSGDLLHLRPGRVPARSDQRAVAVHTDRAGCSCRSRRGWCGRRGSGLRLRIAGEHPTRASRWASTSTVQKYIGVIISGALSGLGGAFIAMELAGFFQEGQTTGRGFIGLAALIFGNWRPWGVLYAALLFGYPFGISLRDLDGQSTHALLLVVAIAFGRGHVLGVAAAQAQRHDPRRLAVDRDGRVVPGLRHRAELAARHAAVRARAARAGLRQPAAAAASRRRAPVPQG